MVVTIFLDVIYFHYFWSFWLFVAIFLLLFSAFLHTKDRSKVVLLMFNHNCKLGNRFMEVSRVIKLFVESYKIL